MLSIFLNPHQRLKTPVLPMLNKRIMRFKGFDGDKYASLPLTMIAQ